MYVTDSFISIFSLFLYFFLSLVFSEARENYQLYLYLAVIPGFQCQASLKNPRINETQKIFTRFSIVFLLRHVLFFIRFIFTSFPRVTKKKEKRT